MSSRSTPHAPNEIMCPACGGAHDPAVTLCYDDEAARGRDTPVVERFRRAGGAGAARQRRDTNPVPVDASAAKALQPGTMVGEFKVEGAIGAGGMGVVYRATHPLIGKKAVIKVIKASLGLEPEHVERFIREARAVNQIGHPNIVDVFSFGTLPDRRPYLVMEWLQGESLGTRLDRGRLPVREGFEILLQICSALDAAHTYGVIHRDLKPDNVYLVALPNDDRPLVKILDFGLAKMTEPKDDLFLGGSNEGVILGTPTYLSPEQARGQSGDHRSDVYTLGVMAFEMFTGHRPFVGASPIETILMHVSKAPPRIRTHKPELPAALDELVFQLMSKDPAARPTLSRVRAALTAELAALDEAHASQPVEDMTGVGTADFQPALRQIKTIEAAWPGHSAGTPLSDLEERRSDPLREEMTRMDADPMAPHGGRNSPSGETPTPLLTPTPTPALTPVEDVHGAVRSPSYASQSSADLRLDTPLPPPRPPSLTARVPAAPLGRPQSGRVSFDTTEATRIAPESEASRRPTLVGPAVAAEEPPPLEDEPTRLPGGLALRYTVEAPRPDVGPPSSAVTIRSPAVPARQTLGHPPRAERTARLAALTTGWLRRHARIAGGVALATVLLVVGIVRLAGSADGGSGGRVRILLHGLPKGSVVTWDKRVLTTNPAWVEQGTTPRQLEIASPGYDPVRIETVPKSNLEFTVELGSARAP